LWADADGSVFAETGRAFIRLGDSRAIPRSSEEGRRLRRVVSGEATAWTTRADRHAYRLEPTGHGLSHRQPTGGTRHIPLTGFEMPSALCLSPDQTLLYVADRRRQLISAFQVGRDGTPTLEQPYFHLHLPDDATGSGVGGLCVDTAGRLYAATPMGVQVFDQAGRVNGIIQPPRRIATVGGLTFGGTTRNELYLLADGHLWRRTLQTRGVFPGAAPILPAPPRL
jgi:sugar lactone lactonase YvrE